ncbi:MAG: hypothetical protein IPJ78_02460 [Gemmatimonadetes bacterium]|jgi:hypothetical protein|nr:hypothetical protein [Gemmatimonadota bacterium]
MSIEDANVLFEKLTLLADGDRAKVWGVISDLKREFNKTPTLGQVVVRLTSSSGEGHAPQQFARKE